MELREFLKPFQKNIGLILGVSLFFGAAAYLVSASLPLKYRASATVYVQRVADESKGNYFTYEGYYAQKAAQEYADTVLGFLQSPDIIHRAVQIVYPKLDEARFKKIQKSIRAEKRAPQLVLVTVTLPNGSEAKQLISALAQAAQERAKLLNQSGNEAMQIDLLASEPLLEEIRPHKGLNSVVASGVGFVLACIIVWLKEYL
ncbi:hypothetical protein B5M47_02940 [candidate division CPR3 bacterium 4484_211]|uniref:Polysaccharide chain length determinant N-terminal domain-containing protein n=1 Tax=candidate division CPR3 bacterium 4484_211 TaxID=1968527 RepID=A0A1W9NXD1_UNCC3|nr:MAG: hypothetical protein B5M47_02940 [candidate division CPR3 bacterium 4484_211]